MANFATDKTVTLTVGDTTLTEKLTLNSTITSGGCEYTLALNSDNTLYLHIFLFDYDEYIGVAWDQYDDGKGVGLSAYWGERTKDNGESVIYLGGSATNETTTVLLKNSGYVNSDLTVFGGKNGANLDNTVVVMNLTCGTLAGIAGGAASKEHTVGSVEISLGGGDEIAQATAIYGGGLGGVNGDIEVNILDNAVVTNGIYGGASLNIANVTLNNGAIYGRGQAENDIVMGDVTITLSGSTEVGSVKAKYSGPLDVVEHSSTSEHYRTDLVLNNFTGNVADRIDGQIDRVIVSGETKGVINGAEAVANWCFDLTANTATDTILTWDSGDFGDDRFDLRVSSQNKCNWILLDLNPDNNVSNAGAFENTTFTLYIDGGDGMNLTLGQTIADGAFAGYTLDCKGDKLTFNNIAAV